MKFRKNKLKLAFWCSLFVGITAAYFIYLSWLKLTELIGSSTIVWIITGSIVLIAILLGKFSIKQIVKRFI